MPRPSDYNPDDGFYYEHPDDCDCNACEDYREDYYTGRGDFAPDDGEPDDDDDDDDDA